jgi:hypothetical protein
MASVYGSEKLEGCMYRCVGSNGNYVKEDGLHVNVITSSVKYVLATSLVIQ